MAPCRESSERLPSVIFSAAGLPQESSLFIRSCEKPRDKWRCNLCRYEAMYERNAGRKGDDKAIRRVSSAVLKDAAGNVESDPMQSCDYCQPPAAQSHSSPCIRLCRHSRACSIEAVLNLVSLHRLDSGTQHLAFWAPPDRTHEVRNINLSPVSSIATATGWCKTSIASYTAAASSAEASLFCLMRALHAPRHLIFINSRPSPPSSRTVASSVSGGRELPIIVTGRPKTDAKSAIEQVPHDLALCQLGDRLAAVRETNRQLRLFLQSLSWPRLMGFQANRLIHGLPVTGKAQPFVELLEPTTTRLSYLAGFFDGDGCVSCNSSFSGCVLSVAQSFDHAEVLMLFRDTFGGSIVRGSRGVGLQKPVISWCVSGQKARRAAGLLAPHSITKRKQLLLASVIWPREELCRHNWAAELRHLKQFDSASSGICTWEYFGGFFDAEGCLTQTGRASLRLEVNQKHVTVLRSLQRFLARATGTMPSIYGGKRAYALVEQRTSACKKILGELLQDRLLPKRAQAEAALSLTYYNSAQVRVALQEMAGNQRFGTKLDQAGVERASKIKRLQNQVGRFRRLGDLQAAEVKLLQILDLKDEHAMHNAQQENRQLLEYIRWVKDLHGSSLQIFDKDQVCSPAKHRPVSSFSAGSTQTGGQGSGADCQESCWNPLAKKLLLLGKGMHTKSHRSWLP